VLSCSLWRGRRWFEPSVFSHHPSKGYANALNDGQQDSASDSIVSHGFRSASHCEGPASHKAANDGIPGILFLSARTSGRRVFGMLELALGRYIPDTFNSAVKC
tara:strand:- start:12429 stop:12740 length:312 start_codon:yes stop_codon:yes gene_type:complete